MPALAETQKLFKAALLGDGAEAFAAQLDQSRIPASVSTAIYRNNVLGGLAMALGLVYPAISALLGEEFFVQTGRAYALAHPPESARLDEWGEGFVDALADLPSCAHLPWLRDVARLEWSVNRALHAPDFTDVACPADRGATDIDLTPRPSLSVLRPIFPADRIRRAALAGGAGLEDIDMAPAPFWLAVYRRDDRIEIRHIEDTAARILHGLLDGASLANSVDGLAPVEASSTVAALIERGLLSWRADVSRPDPHSV
jgi:hypothetical protein